MAKDPYNRTDNPRYVAYARFHGKSPQAMIGHDEARYPGGKMIGFITWMEEQFREFRKQHPEWCLPDRVSNQQEWTRFLENVAVTQCPVAPLK